MADYSDVDKEVEERRKSRGLVVNEDRRKILAIESIADELFRIRLLMEERNFKLC